ncbi:hypothetical protein CRE_21262 [Caenorhabditis remanei]|uniref:Uncharacterized protein n=1 Tax=Caenorhabditis remanei TaxID=31234 RepID=E3MF56_CAERE|nr:hypothetical protein CRE_21262 [Caenorhabditis remanei]
MLNSNNLAEYLLKRKATLETECGKSGSNADQCKTYVNNGHALFCTFTTDFPDCPYSGEFQIFSSPTTTTTTTTTAQPTTEAPSFPMGALLGGFAAGALFGFILMLLIRFVCRRKNKKSLDDGLSTAESGTGKKKKKSKKNKKTGTTTGSGDSTAVTDGSTTGISKTKKNKKKKKGKKGKKDSHTTGSFESNRSGTTDNTGKHKKKGKKTKKDSTKTSGTDA